MRRLTKRKYGGIIPAAQQDIFCSNFCNKCSQGTGDCKELKEMLERLTQIEDILGDEYDLDQLKEMVVHGRWLNFYGDFTCAECSKCGATYDVVNVKPSGELFGEFEKEYKFCPNCGAKMDLEDDKQ